MYFVSLHAAIFHNVLSIAYLSQNQCFFKISFRNTIKVSNNLNPDQLNF